MNIIADTTLDLPFKLDFCAQGADIDPISCRIGSLSVTIYFPPSLSETTDGQGKFGDWAWWTGRRLRLWIEGEVGPPAPNNAGPGVSTEELAALREVIQDAADEVLRRLIKSYRWRFGRPDLYPVRVDPRAVDLYEVLDNGERQALPEPVEAFFYQTMPSAPPLQTSINSSTLDQLERDIREGNEPPVSVQFDLDAEALEAQGDFLRADMLRGLARQQLE